ncbi:hypothetical protein GQ457_01G023040 [Hibiscus cannabinus]
MLLFTDDCLGGKLNPCYASCFGQLINYDKLGALFSTNVSIDNKNDVCRVLGVHHSSNTEKYLGLPSRNKKLVVMELKMLKRTNN